MERTSESFNRQHKDTRRSIFWMQQRLARWFDTNQRTFIWRSQQRNPYIVLVAETMLQQTQVWRVEPILQRFLARFPTIEALASASKAEVIAAWHGLGYNRRAVHLHRCAEKIVVEYGGIIPDNYAALRRLPGIGDYTACALLAFAFGHDVAVIDVNVRRVVSRFFVRQPTEADLLPMPMLRTMADQLMPRGGARWWNEALMDLGSLHCTKRSPRCSNCPVVRRCSSAGQMKLATPGTQKTEPLYRGIPRRLWRGKLIALLRQRTQCTLDECAVALFGTTDDETRAWLETVIAQLERDQLLMRCADGTITLSQL